MTHKKNVEERREVSALCVTSWDQFEMSHDDFADLQDYFFLFKYMRVENNSHSPSLIALWQWLATWFIVFYYLWELQLSKNDVIVIHSRFKWTK